MPYRKGRWAVKSFKKDKLDLNSPLVFKVLNVFERPVIEILGCDKEVLEFQNVQDCSAVNFDHNFPFNREL